MKDALDTAYEAYRIYVKQELESEEALESFAKPVTITYIHIDNPARGKDFVQGFMQDENPAPIAVEYYVPSLLEINGNWQTYRCVVDIVGQTLSDAMIAAKPLLATLVGSVRQRARSYVDPQTSSEKGAGFGVIRIAYTFKMKG